MTRHKSGRVAPVLHAGYPADKPEGTMYSTKCNNTVFIYVQPTDNLVRHKCDSTNGQSGSPMFDANKNIRAVLTGDSVDIGVNSALKVKRRYCCQCQRQL